MCHLTLTCVLFFLSLLLVWLLLVLLMCLLVLRFCNCCCCFFSAARAVVAGAVDADDTDIATVAVYDVVTALKANFTVVTGAAVVL